MRRSVRRVLFAAAALAASVPAVVPSVVLLAVPGLAAEEKPQSGVLDTQRDTPDQKLDAAAAAMQQVASLRETYQQRFDTAPPSKERIANEASTALTKAVTDKGLSVDEYSAILALAQDDPVLRGKIMERMRTQQK